MSSFENLCYISLVGAVGASLRFFIIKLITFFYDKNTTILPYPHHTFVVNILACFLIGLFSAYISQNPLSQMYINIILMGFLAAFSTFSTYITDVYEHFRLQKARRALAYIVLTLLVGMGFEFLGRWTMGVIFDLLS